MLKKKRKEEKKGTVMNSCSTKNRVELERVDTDLPILGNPLVTWNLGVLEKKIKGVIDVYVF